jgi:hypothetical protein
MDNLEATVVNHDDVFVVWATSQWTHPKQVTHKLPKPSMMGETLPTIKAALLIKTSEDKKNSSLKCCYLMKTTNLYC